MASIRDFFRRVLASAPDFTEGASAAAPNTTKGAFNSVLDVTRAVLGSAVDITKETVTAYLAFLKSLVKWSVIVTVFLLPLPIAGSVFHWSWMNGLYLLVLAVICMTLLMAASPLVMLAQLGYEHIKSYRKMAQLRAGVAFWALLIVMYFWLVPVWNYPAAIPLVVIICIFLTVAFVRFGIGLNPTVAVRVILVLLIVITVCFYMPASRSAAGTFVAWLDARVAGFLSSPRRIEYDLSSIDKVVFFDLKTGVPKVWYCAGQDGRIELFDSPGYHPQYKQELRLITPDIVTQINKQMKADAEQIARAQQTGREEAARIAMMREVATAQSKQDVNPVVSAPLAKTQVRVLKPEDTRGEVERQKPKELVKGREEFIKPEESVGEVSRPKKR